MLETVAVVMRGMKRGVFGRVALGRRDCIDKRLRFDS